MLELTSDEIRAETRESGVNLYFVNTVYMELMVVGIHPDLALDRGRWCYYTGMRTPLQCGTKAEEKEEEDRVHPLASNCHCDIVPFPCQMCISVEAYRCLIALVCPASNGLFWCSTVKWASRTGYPLIAVSKI